MKKFIAVVVILIVLVGGGYLIHKHGNKSDATTPTPAASTSTTPSTSSNSTSTIISTKTDSSAGQYLADSSGNALYTYGADKSGVSNCSAGCLTSWPIYEATSSSKLPANVTIIQRSDGKSQYAYKGMPLYTFTSDSAGQVTGDGVSNFHIAKP